MRVAFYAPMKPPDHKVPSGDRRMGRLLMAALAVAGHEVTLASRLRSWDNASRHGRADRLRSLGARLADRLVKRWRISDGRPQAWFTYHLYHKAPDWLGPVVADALDLPYIVAEASHAPKRARGPWADGHAAAADAIRRADAVIAMSDVDADGLKPLVGEPAKLIRLAPFLDTRPYDPPVTGAAAIRAELLARDPGPWLVAVGMMRPGDKERSYAVLSEALAMLGDAPWRLAIIGDGSARNEILGRFDPSRVLAVGEVAEDRLPAWLAAADLMVWPAVNEAYGMALLEAQAAGLPVVAGLSGGVATIVRHGETGLLTPPGEAEPFAAAVRTLLAGPDRRQAMAEAARRTVAAEHGLGRASTILSAAIDAAQRRHARLTLP